MIAPRPPASRRRQGGAVLIVGLIMTVLITLMVVNAFNLSSSNLKAVGNMQMRNEATAAANQALEQVISSPFYTTGAQVVMVDINKDGTNDFQVAVAAPVCRRAWIAAAADVSDVELGPGMSSASIWYTEWDLDGTATDVATGSGASVRVREGVRVAITEAEKNLRCP